MITGILISHTGAHAHALPDGFCVDVYGSNSLQKELDHFQEWIAGLFGAAKLFSDVSLKR